LYAIDAATGHEFWNVPHMSQVIGASKERLHALSNINRLTLLDRKSGSVLGSASTESNDLVYVNQMTDRIFLGTKSGILQGMREQNLEYPQLHITLKKPETTKPKRSQRDAKKEPPTSQATSPFEAPAAKEVFGDPFGTDGGGAKPAAKPPTEKKPTDDPFGA
jgi:hypothetical protein